MNKKIPINNIGPTYLIFSEDLHGLREAWNNRTFLQVRQRYTGWPQGGAVQVSIPGYSASSGSSADSGDRHLPGRHGEGAEPESQNSRHRDLERARAPVGDPSHLPGILLWYGRDWSDILIVGPGSGGNLEELAKTGLVSPYLNTQIIEVQEPGRGGGNCRRTVPRPT